jgi:hypothetical protein
MSWTGSSLNSWNSTCTTSGTTSTSSSLRVLGLLPKGCHLAKKGLLTGYNWWQWLGWHFATAIIFFREKLKQ